MSNGISDLPAANAKCEAYMRDIRESRAEERSAKGHFQMAKEELQNTKLALESGDINDALRHGVRAMNEGIHGADDQLQSDKHKTAAWKGLAEYHDKMGHDPEHATPGSCMTVEVHANPAPSTLSDIISNGFQKL